MVTDLSSFCTKKELKWCMPGFASPRSYEGVEEVEATVIRHITIGDRISWVSQAAHEDEALPGDRS